MKSRFILILIVSILSSRTVFCQKTDSCKVLIPEISKIYEGKCKRGLAHGHGVAIGIDRYEGEFVRGKPYGYGIYTWANGDVYEGNWALGVKNGEGKLIKIKSDSVIIGRWYKNKLISTSDKSFTDYSIQLKQNIEKVMILPQIAGTNNNTIEIVFIRGANIFRSMENMTLLGNSGNVETNSTFAGFTNVTFPFEGNINYTAINKFGTSTINCTLKFTITKPGSWIIKLYF